MNEKSTNKTLSFYTTEAHATALETYQDQNKMSRSQAINQMIEQTCGMAQGDETQFKTTVLYGYDESWRKAQAMAGKPAPKTGQLTIHGPLHADLAQWAKIEEHEATVNLRQFGAYRRISDGGLEYRQFNCLKMTTQPTTIKDILDALSASWLADDHPDVVAYREAEREAREQREIAAAKARKKNQEKEAQGKAKIEARKQAQLEAVKEYATKHKLDEITLRLKHGYDCSDVLARAVVMQCVSQVKLNLDSCPDRRVYGSGSNDDITPDMETLKAIDDIDSELAHFCKLNPELGLRYWVTCEHATDVHVWDTDEPLGPGVMVVITINTGDLAHSYADIITRLA